MSTQSQVGAGQIEKKPHEKDRPHQNRTDDQDHEKDRPHQNRTDDQDHEKDRPHQNQMDDQAHENFHLKAFLYSAREKNFRDIGPGCYAPHWSSWHRAIIIESTRNFFDLEVDTLADEIHGAIHREFDYINLNTHQSLLLFRDIYCDYTLIGKQIYVYLKQKYTARFYIAISRHFEDYQLLPVIMTELETGLEEKFYHPDYHVFTSIDEREDFSTDETRDSQLMQLISEDISRKDVPRLKKHFDRLTEKYRRQTQFSAMYVKFVFSSVIQEFFQEGRFAEERKLDQEIRKLYDSNDVARILEITRQVIIEYECFLNRSVLDSRAEVDYIRTYIRDHCGENLMLEQLAELVHFSAGYLSFVFRRETGMNLNRYILVQSMEKAARLLTETSEHIAQISGQVGYSNPACFQRTFLEHYGKTAEACRQEVG